MNKRIKIFFLFFIIINIFISLSTTSFAGTVSSDINGIDENKYPGVKSKIQVLQSAHPNWTIKVDYTGLNWNEAVAGEHQGHGTITPTSLTTRKGLWACEICGFQTYDTGSWYCASKEALEYMLDVRNSVNETDVFQFMQLSSSEDYTNNSSVKATLKSMASSTDYLDDECINAIISAASTYKVNPYYILAKIIQEQGYTKTTLVSGNGFNGKYPGVYNFFNIGASGSGDSVKVNGLAYAASQGWTSKTASIMGGVNIISQSYIKQGQDTLYYQKFDIIGDSKYSHQYEQNILGAQTAGTTLRKIYLQVDSNLSGYYTFVIPLYENMPSSACARPSTTASRTNSSILMGDVNEDNTINITDVVVMINHLKGTNTLSGNKYEAAKVSGGSNVTITDVVVLINYLKGTGVLASGGYPSGTITSDTNIRLSENGTTYGSLANGTSIKVISKGTNSVGGAIWDLVVSSNGKYGYINRNNWK